LAGNWDVSLKFAEAYILRNDTFLVKVYYVPTQNPDPYPPAISSFLNSIGPAAGAESTFTQSNNNIYENFAVAGRYIDLCIPSFDWEMLMKPKGDWMRNSRPDLETVINAGVSQLLGCLNLSAESHQSSLTGEDNRI
jgi:hypothetical protein